MAGPHRVLAGFRRHLIELPDCGMHDGGAGGVVRPDGDVLRQAAGVASDHLEADDFEVVSGSVGCVLGWRMLLVDPGVTLGATLDEMAGLQARW